MRYENAIANQAIAVETEVMDSRYDTDVGVIGLPIHAPLSIMRCADCEL
jgi:hypothetical protein